jgi:acyl dehydratase
VGELLKRLVTDPSRLVHGGQRIRIHRALPAEAEVQTTAAVRGVYDLKKLCELDIVAETSCEGRVLCETEWSLYVLGAGGQGGRRPARPAGTVRPPRDTPPAWSVEEATRPEQAILYRLSGDPNPLHVDPAVARQAGFDAGPVLHGLCTLGFVARALVWHEAAGDAARVTFLAGQFRRPVWPGDLLRIEGHRVAEGRVALAVTVPGRQDPVLSDCYGEVSAR